jgi:hypothetical protein
MLKIAIGQCEDIESEDAILGILEHMQCWE